MIGRLQGVLSEKQPPFLLLDVLGVGYEVQAPMTTFYRLPEVGEEVTLHIHFSVSENAQQLFGFADKRDRHLFRTLIRVSGVGPKMALGILSGMEANDFARCVMEDNTAALVKVPGVGKKTAERLIIEMRDRLKDWEQPGMEQDKAKESSLVSLPVAENDMIAEAESALVALGYKPTEATRMVTGVMKQQDIDRSEDLIRLALRSMVPA